MRADRIVETCLYAEDLEAAKAFYAALFGREPFTYVPGRHVFFRCGAGVFLIFNPGATAKPAGEIPPHGATGAGHAAFLMDENEIDATREWLRELGVAVETEFAWPGGGFSLYFRDPAGNSLEFTTLKTWGLKA
jgi:catechol 2,3-dioxygenase-like lactoylglutathione lyase family enzyme